MNRHKVPEDEALTCGVKTRITEAHFLRLQQQLKSSHYRTMAELIRDIICEGQIKLVTVDGSLTEVMELLLPIRRELSAIGNNLNQIAKAFNAGKGQQAVHVVEILGLIKEVTGQIEPVNAIVSELARVWLYREHSPKIDEHGTSGAYQDG